MKFSESGLPQDPLVEKAFDYAYENLMSQKKEMMRAFERQVDMLLTQNLTMLELDKKSGELTEEKYAREKEALERMRKEQHQMGPLLVGREMESMFAGKRLGPAKELLQHADGPASGDVVAALLLVDCVRSPVDHQKIVGKFGDKVAGMVAEIVHIDAYPSERETNLGKAAPDVKRAYMALIVSSLGQLVSQVQRMQRLGAGPQVSFQPGQEEQLFNDARASWGNDKKLDQRFIEAFNRAGEVTGSLFRMEVDAQGALELVQGNAPKGPKKLKPPIVPPKGPGNGGGLGEDVF